MYIKYYYIKYIKYGKKDKYKILILYQKKKDKKYNIIENYI